MGTRVTHEETKVLVPEVDLGRVVGDSALKDALDERRVRALDLALPRDVVEVRLRGVACCLLLGGAIG